jgi:hypothetical protein
MAAPEQANGLTDHAMSKVILSEHREPKGALFSTPYSPIRMISKK